MKKVITYLKAGLLTANKGVIQMMFINKIKFYIRSIKYVLRSALSNFSNKDSVTDIEILVCGMTTTNDGYSLASSFLEHKPIEFYDVIVRKWDEENPNISEEDYLFEFEYLTEEKASKIAEFIEHLTNANIEYI